MIKHAAEDDAWPWDRSHIRKLSNYIYFPWLKSHAFTPSAYLVISVGPPSAPGVAVPAFPSAAAPVAADALFSTSSMASTTAVLAGAWNEAILLFFAGYVDGEASCARSSTVSSKRVGGKVAVCYLRASCAAATTETGPGKWIHILAREGAP